MGADPVVVAAQQELPPVQAAEDRAGAFPEVAVAEVAEMRDGVLGAHGRVPVRDRRLVVLVDGCEWRGPSHTGHRGRRRRRGLSSGPRRFAAGDIGGLARGDHPSGPNGVARCRSTDWTRPGSGQKRHGQSRAFLQSWTTITRRAMPTALAGSRQMPISSGRVMAQPSAGLETMAGPRTSQASDSRKSKTCSSGGASAASNTNRLSPDGIRISSCRFAPWWSVTTRSRPSWRLFSISRTTC